MPTFVRVEGYRFFFFSNERNEPPHIHVERGDGYAKFWLNPIGLAESEGFTRPELRRARELTEQHRRLLLRRWHEHFHL